MTRNPLDVYADPPLMPFLSLLRTRLACERLETRWPLSATDVSLQVLVGDTQPGLDGTEFTVDALPDSTQGAGAVASFDNGSQIVVYTVNQAGLMSVYGRRLGTAGEPQGPAFAVITPDFGSSSLNAPLALDVVALDSGEFLVTWAEPLGLRAQRINQQNQPAGPALDVAPLTAGIGAELATTRLTSGDVIVAWAESGAGRLQSVRYDVATGTFDVPAVLVSQADADLFGVRLQAAVDDTWLAFWHQGVPPADTTTTAQLRLQMQTFNALRQPIDLPREFDLPGITTPADAARLAEGNVVVVVQRHTLDETQVVLLQLSPTGELLRERLLVTQPSYLGDAHLSLLSGGEFVVVYPQGTTSQTQLMLQHFNADATPVGGPERVNDASLYPYMDGLPFAQPDGGYSVYWAGWSLDATAPVIRTRRARWESTPLQAQWSADAIAVDSALHALSVTGLPATMGLSHGEPQGSAGWRVPLGEAKNLRLIGPDRLVPLALQVELTETASGAVLDSAQLMLGTEGDDDLVFAPGDAVWDGRAGFDTLVVASDLASWQVEILATGDLRAIDHDTLTQATIRGFESVEYLGNEYDWSQFALLWQTDNPLPPTPPLDPPPADVDVDVEYDDGSGFDNVDEFELWFEWVAQDGELGSAVGDGFDWDWEPLADDAFDETVGDTDDEVADDGAPFESLQGDDPSSPSDANSWPLTEDDSTRFDTSVAGRADVPEGDHDTAGPARDESIDDALGGPLEEIASDAAAAAAAAVSGDEAINEIASELSLSTRVLESLSALSQAVARWDVMRTAHEFVDDEAISRGSSSLTITPPAAAAPVAAPQPGPSARIATAVAEFLGPHLTIPAAFDTELLFTELDQVDQQTQQRVEQLELVVGSAVVIATGFSMAQIAWLLRGSVLVTKTLSSLPVWVGFDPLPVLNVGSQRPLPNSDTPIDESLLDIVSA